VALRRRLSPWQHAAIRVAVATVTPAYTSQNCSRCGLRGKRHRHTVTCPSGGHAQHADVNAATNIRTRYVQSRLDGAPSTAPEALP
jgi:putative transposase